MCAYGAWCAHTPQCVQCVTPFLLVSAFVGSPVDSKYIKIDPQHIAMNKQYVVAASNDTVYLWQYRSSLSPLANDSAAALLRERNEERELIFHIDMGPPSKESGKRITSFANFRMSEMGTSDAICCCALSDKYLVRGVAFRGVAFRGMCELVFFRYVSLIWALTWALGCGVGLGWACSFFDVPCIIR